MPTNQNRELVYSKSYSSVALQVYSTGAAYFSWIGSDGMVTGGTLLRITKASELLSSGYLEKIAHLLEREETHRLSSARHSPIIEYRPERDEECVKYIIDCELEPEAKLIYLLSFSALRFRLTPDALEYIFSKRPNPRSEWESYSSPFKLTEKSLIKYSLMPGFYCPEDLKDREFSDYKRVALTSAFICSDRALTHAEFMAAHAADYFIPHMAATVATSNLFRNTAVKFLDDLRPAEYVRFMEFFSKKVPSELLPWARRRFDSGIMTLREARSKGLGKLHPGIPPGWMEVLFMLSRDEAKGFQSMLLGPNGLSATARGADAKVTPLLAYYYTEGGASRVNELVQHILNEGPGLNYEYARGLELKSNWKNPYDPGKLGAPRLAPYVAALEGEAKDYPLEWSLATAAKN